MIVGLLSLLVIHTLSHSVKVNVTYRIIAVFDLSQKRRFFYPFFYFSVIIYISYWKDKP